MRCEYPLVEARDDHAVHGSACFHEIHDLVLDSVGRVACFKGALLDFDVQHAPGSGQLHHFPKLRHAFCGKARIEPTPGVECFDLREGMTPHRSLPRRGAVQRVVVDHHHLAVLRQGDIQLDHVAAGLHGPFEGGQCIFRVPRRVAAVADEEGTSESG